MNSTSQHSSNTIDGVGTPMDSSRHPTFHNQNPLSPQGLTRRGPQVSFSEKIGSRSTRNSDNSCSTNFTGTQKLDTSTCRLLPEALNDVQNGYSADNASPEEPLKRDVLMKPLYNPSWEFDRSDTFTRARSYGICHLNLTTTITINIILTFSLIAVVCILPMETMSERTIGQLSKVMSTSITSSVAESVVENIHVLPSVLQVVVSGWFLHSENQMWDWSAEDMPLMMQYLCHVAYSQSALNNILYLSFSSPDLGFSAFCGGQYVGYPLVGNYIINGESSPRYVIDTTTYTYADPKVAYAAVKSMTPEEYTVEFGAPNNAWHEVALPFFNDSNSTPEGNYFVFRDGERVSLTYAYPVLDNNKNRILVSGAIQPDILRKLITDNEIASVFGELVLFELVSGAVFGYSSYDVPRARMDNWNWDDPDIDSQVPPLLYINNITSPIIRKAYAEFTKSSAARYSSKWSGEFSFEGAQALVVANVIGSEGTDNVRLVLLYVTVSTSYAHGAKYAKITVFLVIVIILLVLGFADILLVFLLLQPLHGLQDHDVHQEAQDKGFSNISEIATMQRHFMNLNLQLLRMKSFLPHGILGLPPTQDAGQSIDDDDKNEYSVILDTVGFPAGREALDLHLNERALTDQVNHYRRKYCTSAVFFLHITDTEASSSLFGTISGAFLEAVIPTVVQFGGVIEIQRPDALVTTFGAQRYMAMHQQRAIQCALQIEQSVNANSLISSRFVAVIDAEDCFIGTCGAADRFARVTYKHFLPTRPEVIKLCKMLECQTLITQRLAVTLDDNFLLMPVDTIKLQQIHEPLLFYELRGDVRQFSEKSEVDRLRSIISTARNVFERLSRADYIGALQLLEPGEKRDPQFARLLEICREHIQLNDTAPYFRSLDQIRYEMPSYNNTVSTHRSSSAQVAATNTSNQLPDFDVSCFAFPSSSRIIEGCNPFDESSDKSGDDFGALFDVVIEDGEDDDALMSSAIVRSSFLSNTVNTGVFECAVAGEIPTKFVDLGGTEWTRSSDTLGRGAFAEVYRGLSATGTLAALKCIQLRSKNVALSSISEEIRLFSCLDHENIVQYLSVFVSDSYLIQIMEFVPGGALDCLTKSFGPLKSGSCCRFVRDILCGLSYLHSKGIVHCDIKPHNVLLAMDGQCKLSDFGSAIRRAATDGQIDDIIELRGTPGYMAPEVAKGGLPTPKSDIFSLGITILELLLSKLPWAFVTSTDDGKPGSSASSAVPPKGDRKSSGKDGKVGSDAHDPSPLLTDLTELNAAVEEKDCKNSTPPQIPIELLLRKPASFVRAISLGHIAPQIPDTLSSDVVSFIERCICHDPEERATPEELLRHRWVM